MSQPTATARSVASSPFNSAFRPSPDIILRTSDNIDFYAHKLVLAVASPIFETMFSLPQAAEDTSSFAGPPTVEMAEDSQTIDHLLRYIYPVKDPQGVVGDLTLLDRIWRGAKKYVLEEAIDLVTTKLYRCIDSNTSLDVFAIACHHHHESMAMSAASRWRTDSQSQSFENRSWEKSWIFGTFSDTIISRGYCPMMQGRISSGTFFRLMKYYQDGLDTTFVQAAPASNPEVTFQIPPFTTQATSDLYELDGQHATAYPFNRYDYDVILQSHDKINFRVHRVLIELHLDQPLESALQSTASTARGLDSVPILAVKEDGRTLACLLRLCYPPRSGSGCAIAGWTADSLGSEIALQTYQAARRYGFTPILDAYRMRIRQLLPQEPLRMYCTALALGFAEEARSAARQSACTNLRHTYCPELESLLVEEYIRLLRYHHACHAAIRKIWADLFPMQLTRATSSTVETFGFSPLFVTYDQVNPDWLEAPSGSNPLETGIWGALLEEAKTSAKSSTSSMPQLDYKEISSKEKVIQVERKVNTVLDALRL